MYKNKKMFTFFLGGGGCYQGMISFVVKKCLITGWSKATLYEARAVELLILFLMIKWAATFFFFCPFEKQVGCNLVWLISDQKKKKIPDQKCKRVKLFIFVNSMDISPIWLSSGRHAGSKQRDITL